ncbi:enoyl-CoA hydratase-related protein [Microbacterium sp. A84]|uniref:enoyl-CoA hydratase-related protein n=1 Tax=Microbacterium sp. A84 TaxID=3450715 RepID=UPI003F42F31B
MSDAIVLQHEGPVGWLIFNRPDVGNAVNADMMTALPLAWRELDEDPGVRRIVLTGRGCAFQTGLIGVHERVGAQRAYERGFVSELVEAERLQERAQELTEQVADQRTSEAKTIKALLWSTMELGR